MEDGPGACAFLWKAAAALTVLSLLPIAFSGTAPSHAPAALLPISSVGAMGGSAVVATSESAIDVTNGLFASFSYERGKVLGSYVQFGYDATYGGAVSSWV